MQKIKGKYLLDIIDGIAYSSDSWAIYNLYQKMFYKDEKEKRMATVKEPVVNPRLWTFNGEIIKGNDVKQWTLDALIEEYKRLMWKYQFQAEKMVQLGVELRKVKRRLTNG